VEGSTRCNIPNLGQYRLLFDSDGGRLERRIYSMRADGSDIEPITPPEELAREPSLSPDGRQLAYTTPEGIRLRDMDSGQSQLVASQADQPMWSHDGANLFCRGRADPAFGGGNCFRRLVVSNGAIAEDDCLFGDASGTSATLTPDDSSVIQGGTSPQEGISFAYRLVLTDFATGAGRSLVPDSPVMILQPTVSPDGIWLAAAYQCTDAEPFSLWASPMSVLTAACEGRRITRAGAPRATNPEWGPGVLIAYERGEPPRDLAIIAADTGEECILPGLGDDRNPTWGIVAPSVPE
jgi:Tol biopolymer transport system component